jgi:hypothetical protein
MGRLDFFMTRNVSEDRCCLRSSAHSLYQRRRQKVMSFPRELLVLLLGLSLTAAAMAQEGVTRPTLNSAETAQSVGLGDTLNVLTLSKLKELLVRPSIVSVGGASAPGDGGGGLFYWAAGDASNTDDAMVIGPNRGPAGRYKRVHDGVIRVKWFNAKGDNRTDDTAAINAAIAYANSLQFPVRLHFDPGQYRITAALREITKPIRLTGDGPRAAILAFAGSYDCITIKSTIPGVRVANAGLRGLGLYASGMTGGNLIVVDYAQGTELSDLIVDSPYNLLSIRQSGETRLSNIHMASIRGEYGVKAYGAGGLRNDAGSRDQIDKIDVIEFRSVVFQGAAKSGTPSNTDLVWLDGYVQTVDIVNVALLTAGRAIRATNTPKMANPLWPSFITAHNLQIESPYLEAMRLDFLNTANFSGLWISGSITENGIYAGANVREVTIQGRIENNFFHGAQFDGSSDINLTGAWVYRNSLVGSGLKSGIYLGPRAVTNFTMLGGLAGKATGSTNYAEFQKYGIDDNAQRDGKVIGTMMNGNTDGKTSGTIPTFAIP